MRLSYIRKLLQIQGYFIASLKVEPRRGRKAVILELKRLRGPHACGKCGQLVPKPHSNWVIEVQHLTWWQYPTFLKVRRYRVNCPVCGLMLEPLPFVAEGPLVTRPLAALAAELCKVMSVQAVGLLTTLHRATVKTLDKLAMQKVHNTRPLDGIKVLGADEISVGKGQTYWSMISALEGPRGPEMLDVVEGRKERNLKKFWKRFGSERASLVTCAVMDMWKPFRNSFKAHCKRDGFAIIYDKFHVIRHLLEALNKIRIGAFHKALGRFKGTLSGKKFLLLARRSHVRGKAREALNAILAASPRLLKAHLLKESFGRLWGYRYKGCVRKFWENWKSQLKWSRLKPYRKFAKMVDKHFEGILAYCDHPVSLGYIESANLKARNAIRMAYGFRDKDYMKLKIIQACTPWMREFHPWAFAYPNTS